MGLSSRTLGLASATGAAVVFSANDMAIKFISSDYALHQVILIRSLVAIILILFVLMPLQGGWHLIRTGRLAMHLTRGMCVVLANIFFFLALSVMPLAEAVAVFFVSPLMITALSVVFLGEKVGPRRWAAIGIGLLGVGMILRPGSDAFQPAALLVVLSAGFYAMLHILTRKIGGTEQAATMAFYIQITFIAISAVSGLLLGDGQFDTGREGPLAFLFRAWVWPDAADWPILIAVGLASGLGGFLISNAYRQCEAALAAPFEYAALPMAVFWGVVVFGEWPDAIAWAGISLIVAGGLYMMWRETVMARGPEGAA